jgi:hypothetical protein
MLRVETQVRGVAEDFDRLCEEIEMTPTTRSQLRRLAGLNPNIISGGEALNPKSWQLVVEASVLFLSISHFRNVFIAQCPCCTNPNNRSQDRCQLGMELDRDPRQPHPIQWLKDSSQSGEAHELDS